MKKTIIASLISSAFTSPVFAAENINLEDVVVTASRVQQPRTNVVGDVTVITREVIERAGAGSITDLLSTQPGVQISSNGGAGKTSSIYLRGTNADHLIVLVDGLRINSATSGTTAFENIPLAQIERIEILRGPASSLYGSDAIGGVIQIFTRKTEQEIPLIHAAIGVGSYNTTSAEAGIVGGFSGTHYGVNINTLNTDGFSAKRNGVAFDKDNDAYRNLGLTANINHKFNENNEVGAQFLQTEGNSDYDCYSKTSKGVVTKDGRVCEIEQTLRSYGIYSRNQFTPVWQSILKFGIATDNSEDFSGRSKTGAVSYSEYRTEQRQVTWQHDLSLPVGMLTLAYDRLEQKIDSTTLYKKNTRNNNGYLASYLADIDNHALQLSIRNDDNSQFGKYTTGGVGYGYRITPEWRVTANYGKAFKAPTFNQLYFPDFGDQSLIPEKSENIEASLKYNDKRFNASITAFENHIRDLITSNGPKRSDCTASSCAANLNKVEIVGVTFDGGWNVADSLLLSGNYTVQSPRIENSNRTNENNNLLARRGNRYGAINLLHSWGDLQWGAEVTGASTRYNDLANTKKMSGYMLLNLTANYKLSPEWKLEARANNIMDKNYVLAYTGNTVTSAAYNTAGSNLFVGLRYDMK